MTSAISRGSPMRPSGTFAAGGGDRLLRAALAGDLLAEAARRPSTGSVATGPGVTALTSTPSPRPAVGEGA